MKNKNLQLQEKIDALINDVRVIKGNLRSSDHPDDEYLYNRYLMLWEELNSAHSTILGIGRAEDKLKKS